MSHPRRFVILSSPRSGSTWVIDRLNSHPEAAVYTELFVPSGDGYPKWGGAKDLEFWNTYYAQQPAGRRGRIFRPFVCWGYLNRIYRQQPGIRSVGFKLMSGQLKRYPEIFPYLVCRRVSILHLIRRNHLDVLISEATGAARGTFHVKKGSSVAPVRVRLDTEKLLEELEWREKGIRRMKLLFSATPLPYHQIFYEDLIQNRPSTEELLAMVGLSANHTELSSDLIKQNSASHRDLLENYEDVKRCLENSRFRSLLQD